MPKGSGSGCSCGCWQLVQCRCNVGAVLVQDLSTCQVQNEIYMAARAVGPLRRPDALSCHVHGRPVRDVTQDSMCHAPPPCAMLHRTVTRAGMLRARHGASRLIRIHPLSPTPWLHTAAADASTSADGLWRVMLGAWCLARRRRCSAAILLADAGTSTHRACESLSFACSCRSWLV